MALIAGKFCHIVLETRNEFWAPLKSKQQMIITDMKWGTGTSGNIYCISLTFWKSKSEACKNQQDSILPTAPDFPETFKEDVAVQTEEEQTKKEWQDKALITRTNVQHNQILLKGKIEREGG